MHVPLVVTPLQIVAKFQKLHAADWEGDEPNSANWDHWTGGSADREMALFDEVAAELAQGYFEKRYSFAFCDAVVNHLYGLLMGKQERTPPPPWPKLFWRVYEAFDAGEFANPSLPAHDPIKTYTDPEIAEIVREL